MEQKGNTMDQKRNTAETKLIYFWGACVRCEIVTDPQGRYICTAEGYHIYDTEEFEGRFVAVKA